MPIWIKLKVMARYDKISNVGTKTRLIDNKRVTIDPDGSDAFSIKKGQFQPIPFEWKPEYKIDKETKKKVLVTPGLEEAKKKFDPKFFEFFETKEGVQNKIKKEVKLLELLPILRMEQKQKRANDKVKNSKYGKNRPTIEDVVREAKVLGIDIPMR